MLTISTTNWSSGFGWRYYFLLAALSLSTAAVLAQSADSRYESANQISQDQKQQQRDHHAAFFNWPIGKTFWIEVDQTKSRSDRIALYKKFDPSEFAEDLLSDAFYPKDTVKLLVLDIQRSKAFSRLGQYKYVYSVRLDDGTLAYLDGELFGDYLGSMTQSRGRVHAAYAPGTQEHLYTADPLPLKQASIEAHDANAAQEARARVAADNEYKRKGGVRVGMTKKQVLASNWGRPVKVNTTTNAVGVSEQWVYEGSYLYFANGILKTIQN